MVSQLHYDRASHLLEHTKGTFVTGGGKDPQQLKIEPTIVTNVDKDDVLMEGEIFAPILPIIEIGTVEDAFDFLVDRSVFSSTQIYNLTDLSETRH